MREAPCCDRPLPATPRTTAEALLAVRHAVRDLGEVLWEEVPVVQLTVELLARDLPRR